MDIIKLAKQEEQRLISYRRYLHENPELSGVEYNTLRFIKEKLDELGVAFIEVKNGGILATIDSNKPGKTVLLRADMDALPINEDSYNGEGYLKPCVSKTPNVQHACGHDAHTAILLVVAKILKENTEAFCGKVVLCFEQGEEANGNVFYLLKYFELNNLHFDSCFGLHVGGFVSAEPGAIIIKPGQFMAGMRSFRVTLKGQGGHGSRPDLANSPIDCFCSINQAIADLRMKKIDPFEPITYSLGFVNAGTKTNIIPASLEFGGSIRYYDAKHVGNKFWDAIKNVIEHTAKMCNCEVEYGEVIIPGYPVINNVECTDIAFDAITELFDDVGTSTPQLGTESFSYYQQSIPGVFIVLSTQNIQKGITAGNHTAKFDVDEASLYKGVCCHIAYALAFLNGDQTINFTPNPMSVDEILKDCGRTL